MFSNYISRYTLGFILQNSNLGWGGANFLCVIKQCVPITNCLIHIPNQSRPQATLWSQPNLSTVSSHLLFQFLFSSWRLVVQVLDKIQSTVFFFKLALPKGTSKATAMHKGMALHMDTNIKGVPEFSQ